MRVQLIMLCVVVAQLIILYLFLLAEGYYGFSVVMLMSKRLEILFTIIMHDFLGLSITHNPYFKHI